MKHLKYYLLIDKLHLDI